MNVKPPDRPVTLGFLTLACAIIIVQVVALASSIWVLLDGSHFLDLGPFQLGIMTALLSFLGATYTMFFAERTRGPLEDAVPITFLMFGTVCSIVSFAAILIPKLIALAVTVVFVLLSMHAMLFWGFWSGRVDDEWPAAVFPYVPDLLRNEAHDALSDRSGGTRPEEHDSPERDSD